MKSRTRASRARHNATRRSAAWQVIAVAGAAIATLILAACSSSGGSAPTSTAQSAPGATQSSGGGGATVMVRNGSVGAYLVDAAGRTLYLFAPDTTNKSTCNGPCATIWPPLTTTGAPQAGTGANASMLGTSARDDGTTQVTYNGHPLYYYVGDSSPGQTNGQGLNANGGLWWVVSPKGSAITGGSGTPSPTNT